MKHDVTAFVLAGGRSSRMGQDKALLRHASGTTLLEHVLAIARSVADRVTLIASREKYSSIVHGIEIVEDVYPGCGPLGGIHAALGATSTDLNLVIATDMPNLNSGLLRFLLERARSTDHVVTIPRVGELPQPLCAVYRRAFLFAAEQALRSGRYRIHTALNQVSTGVISEAELTAAGFGAELFANANTPGEWEALRRSC